MTTPPVSVFWKRGDDVLIDGTYPAKFLSYTHGTAGVVLKSDHQTYAVKPHRLLPAKRCYCGRPLHTTAQDLCANHD